MPILKKKRLSGIQRLIQAVPGKKYFGIYRFMPIFFFIGAGLEFAMIHWKPNGHNFCKHKRICIANRNLMNFPFRSHL